MVSGCIDVKTIGDMDDSENVFVLTDGFNVSTLPRAFSRIFSVPLCTRCVENLRGVSKIPLPPIRGKVVVTVAAQRNNWR